MRISTWLLLSAVCVLAGSLSASPLAARSTTAHPKKPVIHQEFNGFGKTELAAQKSALETACAWLKDESDLGWSADPDYLVTHKMIQFGAAEDSKFNDPTVRDTLVGMKVVNMQLEISADQLRDIHKLVQQERMKGRQKQSLLVLLGAVGLLSVVGGYLRLEEATKGYYTRLLRIAAIGAVAVLVAGLCVAG